MAGTEDIIQNIVLAGQQDVIAGLDAIGNAGVKAFEAIGNSVANLGNIGSAFAGLAGVAGALAGVTAGVFALSDAAANNVVKMANFADEMGTTTGQMGLFITALNQAGNQTADLTVSFRRIAVAVEAAWPKMQKQIREAANTIKEDYIKVGEAGIELAFQSTKAAETQIKDAQDVAQARINLTKSQLDASRIDQTNAIASIQAAQSVIGAVNNLAAAQFNLRQLQGGVSEAEKKQFAIQQAENAVQQAETELRLALLRQQREEEDQQIRKEQALLDVKQKRLALQESLTKQAEDAALAPFKQAEAELKLSQAQEKQQEDQINSVSNLKKFIDDLAAGADVTGQKVQISTQNVIKGLIASVGSSANALQGFSGNLGDVTNKTPALFDVMKKVADVFENTKDATLRAALATALFGRGYSFTLVAALEEGGAALQKNMDRLRDLGFEFTSFDEKVGRDFLKALGSVESELKILGTQLGLTFAPSFTVILRQIQQAVEDNRVKILQWATAVKDAALPVIAGFLKAIAGIDVTKALQLNPDQIIQAEGWATSFDKVKQFVKDFASGAKDIILNTIIPAFDVIKQALDDVASGINKVFGTKLTGGDLGIGILILGFSGLTQAIIATTTAFALLTIAFATNPFGLATLAISAAIIAAAALALVITRNREAIANFVTLKVEGAWNWLLDTFEDIATKVKRGFEDLKQAAFDLVTFTSSATIAANQKVTDALRASQDQATADARRARDEAAKAIGPSNADASTAPTTAPIDQAKTKWDELGKTIQDVTTKTGDGLKTTTLDAITVTEEASTGVKNLVNANTDAVKQSFKDTSKAAQFAADDLKGRLANFAHFNDPFADHFIEHGFGPSVNPFAGSVFGEQIGGPQTTIIPKTQVLGDLQTINQELGKTGQAIIRTFGGEGVAETKVNVEGFNKAKEAVSDLAFSTEQNGQRIIRVMGPGGELSRSLQKIGDDTKEPLQEASNAVKDFGTNTEDIKKPLDDIGNTIDTFGQKTEAIKFVGGDLANPFQQASDTIKSAFDSLPDAFQNTFDQIVQKAQQAAQQIAQAFQQASQSATSAGGSSSSSDSGFSSPSNPPSGPGFAEGGLFRGRGGIDTNLAWLTDMEFIMNPAAVKHWGVNFLHSLNRMQMPGFSMGGLFRSAGERLSAPMTLIPAFAGGGLNRSVAAGLSGPERRALTLVLGGQQFPGLSGPADVVDALERHAVHDQLKTSGYQPRWKK